MTVCIVSHSYPTNAFVAVADEMLSMSDMSADNLAIKSFAVGNTWMCMFSADELSPVVAISNTVKSQVSAIATLEEVINVFQSAFRKELVAKAESSVLAPFNMSMADFRTSGLASFGPEIFSRMFYQIEQLFLDVTFLVYGFENTKPHIFTIQNKGEVSHFDQPGFWAIGSGQTSALGSLFSLTGPSVCVKSLENVLYLLCKAKFNAESARGVGQNTTAIILKSNGNRFLIFKDAVGKLKEIWIANRPPAIPQGAEETAKALIQGAAKPRGTRSRSPKVDGKS
jgi:hypothetical protein